MDSSVQAVFLQKPEEFLGSKEIREDVLSSLKALYHLSHSSHGDESLLPELVTEGFDDDQIWEQLQLQNRVANLQVASKLKSFQRSAQKPWIVVNDVVPRSYKRPLANISKVEDTTGGHAMGHSSEEDTGSVHSEEDDDASMEEEGFDGDGGDDDELDEDEDERSKRNVEIEGDLLPEEKELEDGFFNWNDMETAANEGFEDEVDLEGDSDEETTENVFFKDFFGGDGKPSKEKAEKDTGNVEQAKMTKFQADTEKVTDQIQDLESENINVKPWNLIGEVTSKGRPENSLLEAELEYDKTNRVAPAITIETTEELEMVIKKRIEEKLWDDPVRKVPSDEDASRSKRASNSALSQEKSREGLGDIYAQEYLKNTTEEEDAFDPDEDEIQKMFSSLCSKLDALSNYHFTPKPANIEIEVQKVMPALNMEETIPLAVSDSMRTAPEEVHDRAHGKKGFEKSANEMTSSERKAGRKMKKKKKKKMNGKDGAQKFNHKDNVHDSMSGGDVGTSSSKFFKALQDDASAAIRGDGPKKVKPAGPVSQASKLKL